MRQLKTDEELRKVNTLEQLLKTTVNKNSVFNEAKVAATLPTSCLRSSAFQ